MKGDQLGDMSGGQFSVSVNERQTKVRLSSQLYDTLGKAFREMFTNSEASILQLPSNVEETGQIYVDIFTDGKEYDQNASINIRVQDTGIGMTKDEIKKVLANFTEQGSRTAEGGRNESEIVSKFGIGFFSVFSQTGKDGLIRFEAAPVNKNTVNRCFMTLDEGVFVDKEKYETYGRDSVFSPDSHGMSIAYVVKENNHTPSDFFEWAEEYAEFVRPEVTIRLRDKETGSKIRTSQTGGFSLTNAIPEEQSEELCAENFSSIDGGNYHYHYENEYVELIASPLVNVGSDKDSQLILVSYALEESLSIDYFGTCIVRFKTEKPIIINENSVNYGKIVTESVSQVENNPSEYVLRDNIENSDVVIPTPTTNRDSIRIEERKELENYVNSILEQKRNEFVRSVFPEKKNELTNKSQNYVPQVKEVILSRDFANKGYKICDAPKLDSSQLRWLLNSVEGETRTGLVYTRLTEMDSTVSVHTGIESIETMDFHQSMKLHGDNNNLFLCVSENESKIRAVFEHFSNPIVISVESTDYYDLASDYTENVRFLKKITKSKVKEMNVSHETEKQFGLVVSDVNEEETIKYGDTELTIHAGRSRDDKRKVTVSFLCSETRNIINSDERKSAEIILFPRSSDESIRDYYDAASQHSILVSCRDSVAEVIQQNTSDGIVTTIDKKIASLESYYGFTGGMERVSLHSIWKDSSQSLTIVPFNEEIMSAILELNVLEAFTDELRFNNTVYVHEDIVHGNEIAFTNTDYAVPSTLGSKCLNLNDAHKKEYDNYCSSFRKTITRVAFNSDKALQSEAKRLFTQGYGNLDGDELELLKQTVEMLND